MDNETDCNRKRWLGVMVVASPTITAAKDPVERRVIRIDNLPDQAGIAAALRRAFADRTLAPGIAEDDPFDALLKQIH